MEGREKGGGGEEGATERGASITPLNLPVTAWLAWVEEGLKGRRESALHPQLVEASFFFLNTKFLFLFFFFLQNLACKKGTLNIPISLIDFPEPTQFC